ncbi:MAG: GEVED domain-containing protein, partial [Dehalococcoidales bacterium]|nr:GEVED domain-containing protein [Dehalococcoidales bacterium]
NRDGTFDPVTEMIFSSATTSSNTVSASVQIPYTAMNGNTVMRVVLNQTTSAASVAPCGNYTYGETEDYMVTVAPQASCDAGVIAIMSPDAFTQSGTLQPVWVKFMNFGSNPITAGALSVAYRLNNGTPLVMPYPGSMAPGAIDSLQMTSVNIPMGNNALCAYTILGCDSNMFNNEICKSIYGQYYTTLPYFDNFETSNMWYKPSTSTNWQYGTPSANIINTAYSGVKAWVTNLTGDYSNNASEYLYSPMFDFSGLGSSDTITLSFYHWCAMATSDYGRVQYSDDGGQSWSNLGFFGDPMGTNWYNTQSGGVHYFSITNSGWMYSAYKLDPYIFNGNPLIQFRFHFYSNASGTSNGWAIDNYRLALPLVPNDVGITAINTPINDTAAGSQAFTTVTISNFGTSSQYMIPLEMELNGVLVSAETWTGTLASQASTTYTFILPYAVPVTSYQLCAKTLLPGDPFASNDAMCRSYGVQPAYHDVGVGRIMSPLPDSAGRICLYNAQIQPWYQYYIAIKLHNYGQNAQVSIPVKYTFYNGGPVQTSTWTGSLVFGDSADFLLSTLFLPNAGIQQVCVETDLLGDMVSVNNKYCQTYNGVMCIGVEDLEPEGFALMQNVPNPAKGTTLIGYSIPQAGDVTFGVVSLLGQVMHSEVRTVPAGQHQLELDVSTLAAGVYYYFAEFNGQRLTKKLVINR